MTVVLATRNAGKAQEFGRLLAEKFVVERLPDEVDMPDETGRTFRENAYLKAQAVFVALGGETAVLADDSGLEVCALDNRPGVQSARYAGDHASDEANVQKLLGELGGRTDRKARFVCCLCLVTPSHGAKTSSSGCAGEPAVIEVQGIVEGTIETAPHGTKGFGYDPVFRPKGWQETLGETSADRKDGVSHRGTAARALLLRLNELGG